MQAPLVPRRASLAVALVTAASLGACVAVSRDVKTQSLGDGEFHLECRGALASCLQEADRLCMGNRYQVQSGRDDRDYLGPATVAESETRTSEAVIRCGPRGRTLFGRASKKEESAGAPPSVGAVETTAAPPAPSPRACVPGATQACVGAGACAGGQSCNLDGSAFGPCDCGGPRGP